MTTFLASLACLFIGWGLGRWRLGVVQNRGEAAVRRTLAAHFASTSYHLMNNVTLPIEGGTTQVDHLLVSRFGVFVIETKHYTGWIFGSSSSRQWTQVLFKKHYKFQNPIHQNRLHVNAVSKLLDFLPAEHVHSIVVFTGDAVFKTEMPQEVMPLDRLAGYIDRLKNEILSDNRMQFCVGRLECTRKALTTQTDIEHVAHLRRKFGDSA
jgi:restriction system protein